MIDPRGLSMRDWCDALVQTLDVGWPLGRVEGDDWQTFAVGLLRAPDLVGRPIPDPYQFTDWREWAMRAAPMLENA